MAQLILCGHNLDQLSPPGTRRCKHGAWHQSMLVSLAGQSSSNLGAPRLGFEGARLYATTIVEALRNVILDVVSRHGYTWESYLLSPLPLHLPEWSSGPVISKQGEEFKTFSSITRYIYLHVRGFLLGLFA